MIKFSINMKMFLLTVFMWTLIGCTGSEHKEVNRVTEHKESISIPENKEFIPPTDWKIITACEMQFYVPPNLKEEKVQPFDSCVKLFGSENIRILIDVLDGQPRSNFTSSSENSTRNNFKLEKTNIDRENAEIITFSGAGMDLNAKGLNYGAVLDVPQMKLTMWTYSKSLEERENVIKIFKSIKAKAAQ